MRKYLAFPIGAVFLMTVLWFGRQPPSDDAVIAIYQEHQASLRHLVQLYQEDQVGVIVHKNGSIYPTTAEEQLSSDRLALYRTLVKESGVTRSLGGNAAGQVTFQIFNLIPFSPMKTIVYSPAPPPLLTAGNTDDYTFASGQYQQVCRLIEASWYLCLDYED